MEVGLGRSCDLLGSEKPLEKPFLDLGVERNIYIHVLGELELGENVVRKSNQEDSSVMQM